MAFLRAIRRFLAAMVIGGTLLALGIVLLLPRINPADLPWTALDLEAPVGRATAGKIARLDAPACLALLEEARIAVRTLPPRRGGDAACRFEDGVAWAEGGARRIAYGAPQPALACPLAAAVALWEREYVQPAAEAIMGSRVVRIDHFGSYSCRRLYGRESGGWSEHARARAFDIAGFRFADGRRVTVARDWTGDDAAARFLRAARDGACRTFSTTLSPDYNAAHRDHFHLDMAERGAFWRACR